MLAIAYFWLVLGLLLDGFNLCWYAIGVWKLSRLKPGEKRPHIPSAVPFVSLPMYIIYCLLVPITYHLERLSVLPLPFELKLGLAIIVGHVVFHLTAISIFRCLYRRVAS